MGDNRAVAGPATLREQAARACPAPPARPRGPDADRPSGPGAARAGTATGNRRGQAAAGLPGRRRTGRGRPHRAARPSARKPVLPHRAAEPAGRPRSTPPGSRVRQPGHRVCRRVHRAGAAAPPAGQGGFIRPGAGRLGARRIAAGDHSAGRSAVGTGRPYRRPRSDREGRPPIGVGARQSVPRGGTARARGPPRRPGSPGARDPHRTSTPEAAASR